MNKGFTLVETLVAVTILMVGVVGPLWLAAQGIADGFFAQNQITATYLAEEALETITNKRDSNVLLGQPALDNIPTGNNINIDPKTADISTNCPTGGCYLTYNETEKRYKSGGNSGPFQRQIEISDVVGSDSAVIGKQVVVTVKWLNRSVQKTFNLANYVYAE